MSEDKIVVHRLTDAKADVLFTQREEQLQRTAYETEKLFCYLLRSGNPDLLRATGAFLKANRKPDGTAVGNLSANNVRQAQYMTVVFMTMATRVAIEAGVPEAEAYSFSDETILRADQMNDEKSVYQVLNEAVSTTVNRIAALKTRYSRLINRTLSYISAHLHEPLSLETMAKQLKVSPAYLSRRFHQETGMTFTAYVLSEKLKEAEMLLDVKNMSCADTAAMLGFSSQSQFTACFKKKYGIPPGQYKRERRSAWW